MIGMIGIFGGTFDPVHYGHLETASEVSRALKLEQLFFVPAANPPHRTPPVASFEHRVNMLRLALPMYEGFQLDVREQRLGGISYTVRTLESLRTELGDRSLGLIMGADAFAGFESWHHWQHIPDLAHLIIMNRPGFATTGLPHWARQRVTDDLDQLHRVSAGLIYPVSVKPVPVSATGVRTALDRNESVKEMLPPAVLDYIESNNLYG